MAKGLIISGEFGNIVVREKTGKKLELGELLMAETGDQKILFQVFDLVYGSQLSQQNLELVSGLRLEGDSDMELMDGNLRNYILAKIKSLVTIQNNKAIAPKTLPNFFSSVRAVVKEDFDFLLTKTNHRFFIGNLRSGTKVLDLPIFLDGEKVLSHHILISGTTGRGKSVLMSNLLWHMISETYCSLLVLDPHDEYYGRNKIGLKDHPEAKEKLVYYTPRNPPAGCKTLKINLESLYPNHFNGVVYWSDAQKQALAAYYRKYQQKWIEAIVLEKPLDVKFIEATTDVVRRKIMQILHLNVESETLICKGIFDKEAGQTTVKDIMGELGSGKTVVIDTSEFDGAVEILIGGILATNALNSHKNCSSDELRQKPVISIVLEEAPRVLGKEALERGPNVFSTIAREGRKFKIGLTAITQLPSLIPRDILANMNTKIILGVELKPERQALIESAAQDLSSDERNIASLDIGEAIVSSNFAKFAIPVKIPFFNDIVEAAKQISVKQNFEGVKLR
ncbi:ATP-binding protein [Candidatus Woesearchaeota archaeon]|nr:ATP-binding protein [Candidatus Woesearchaeota archaeon]